MVGNVSSNQLPPFRINVKKIAFENKERTTD